MYSSRFQQGALSCHPSVCNRGCLCLFVQDPYIASFIKELFVWFANVWTDDKCCGWEPVTGSRLSIRSPYRGGNGSCLATRSYIFYLVCKESCNGLLVSIYDHHIRVEVVFQLHFNHYKLQMTIQPRMLHTIMVIYFCRKLHLHDHHIMVGEKRWELFGSCIIV